MGGSNEIWVMLEAASPNWLEVAHRVPGLSVWMHARGLEVRMWPSSVEMFCPGEHIGDLWPCERFPAFVFYLLTSLLTYAETFEKVIRNFYVRFFFFHAGHFTHIRRAWHHTSRCYGQIHSIIENDFVVVFPTIVRSLVRIWEGDRSHHIVEMSTEQHRIGKRESIWCARTHFIFQITHQIGYLLSPHSILRPVVGLSSAVTMALLPNLLCASVWRLRRHLIKYDLKVAKTKCTVAQTPPNTWLEWTERQMMPAQMHACDGGREWNSEALHSHIQFNSMQVEAKIFLFGAPPNHHRHSRMVLSTDLSNLYPMRTSVDSSTCSTPMLDSMTQKWVNDSIV